MWKPAPSYPIPGKRVQHDKSRIRNPDAAFVCRASVFDLRSGRDDDFGLILPLRQNIVICVITVIAARFWAPGYRREATRLPQNDSPICAADTPTAAAWWMMIVSIA